MRDAMMFKILHMVNFFDIIIWHKLLLSLP